MRAKKKMPMKTPLPLSSLALAMTLSSAVLAGAVPCAPALPPAVSQGAPAVDSSSSTEQPKEQADPLRLARASSDAMNAQLALLQGIKDKATADAAAPGLLEETEKLNEVTRTLAALDFEGLSYDEEAYMELVPQIFAASEDVNEEFARLEKADWYGSEALKHAVEEANAPVFSDEEASRDEPSRPLTPEQEEAELERMRALVALDGELLATLKNISSATTASAAVPALRAYVAKLEKRKPDPETVDGYFEDADAPGVVGAFRPVRDKLELIRTELLRIVGLDGFQTKAFDPFNDAMDDVFRLLEETHDFWYGDIFDENFEDAVFDTLDRKSGGKNADTPAS